MKKRPMKEANIVRVTELSPTNDPRKSFYGKAKVLTYDDGSHELQSYDTIVSREKDGKVSHLGKYSQTTSRHQKEFEKQFGKKNESLLKESMTAQQLSKEMESAVNWLIDADEGCSTIKLDYYPLAVCVGWQDGYDTDDNDGLIHSKSEPSWVIVAGIKVWTSDSMRTDFDWINSPYKENGEVINNDVTLEAGNPGGEAMWLMTAYEKLVEYLENNHLTIEDDGKIVKEDDDDYYDESLNKVSESKKRGKGMRTLRESYDDYDYYGAVREDIESALEEDYYEEILKSASDEDEAYEELYDKLWVDDSVTGNASGSYTFSTYEAEEYICHNLALLCEAIEEFGGEASEYKRCLESPETADVTIRCYLLGQVLREVLSEYEFGE